MTNALIGHNSQHRATCDLAVDLIKAFEGYSPTIYICAGGYPTIGWGHLIKKRDREKYVGGIDETTATMLLRRDLIDAEQHVARFISVDLSDEQHGALVSFTFNLGGGALQSSTLRGLLNDGKYVDAANEFVRWVFAGGKKLKGLIRRRRAEKDMFMIGVLNPSYRFESTLSPAAKTLRRPGGMYKKIFGNL